MTSRRAFVAGVAAAALACRSKPDDGPGITPGPSPVPTGSALERGARWLASRQSDDGTWVSDVYGAFKDGYTLTPFAALALLESGVESGAAKRGCAWLASKTKDGRVVPGRVTPSYPAYTAALAALALTIAKDAAKDAWFTELRSRQLTEELGWSKDDAHYGGWGYSTALPRKPREKGVADAFLESNLSTTAFALDALASAVATRTDAAFEKALVFVERQQNFAWGNPGLEDDGGFFFIPDDDVRNKAGAFGDRKDRFHSYGTMTADGLRSLHRCKGHEHRIALARRWLTDRFDAAHHPGTYRPEREETRDSAWFYWAWSLAATIRVDGASGATAPQAGALSALAAPLRAEILRRQRADGSWQNDLQAVREDDPIVATCFALRALAALTS